MEIKAGYKKTEIGVIPEDWGILKISDMSNVVRGGSPRPAGDPKYFNGKYIPWLTVAALTNISDSQIYVLETETFLTEEGSVLSRKLESGTLIIANSGATLGIAKLLAIKCCANDGIAALLDVNSKIDKTYIAYYINTLTKYLRDVIATGNGQPNLNTELIGNLKFPSPSTKAEQTAIATALSDADALITSLEKLIAKKRNIKQGAMQELLKPKEGWEGKRLGDCLLQNPDYGINAASVTYDDTLPTYLRITDISETGKFLYSTKVSVNNTLSNSYYLDEGDIVFARTGASVGKTYIYDKNDGRLVFAGFLIRVKANSNILHYKYLFFLTQTRSYWAWVSANSMRSGQPGLNSAEYKSFQISFPTLPEQARIATILSDMDTEIATLETKLDKYKMIKQGMMQNLLTGKIRLI